jgi:hypothetical protein
MLRRRPVVGVCARQGTWRTSAHKRVSFSGWLDGRGSLNGRECADELRLGWDTVRNVVRSTMRLYVVDETLSPFRRATETVRFARTRSRSKAARARKGKPINNRARGEQASSRRNGPVCGRVGGDAVRPVPRLPERAKLATGIVSRTNYPLAGIALLPPPRFYARRPRSLTHVPRGVTAAQHRPAAQRIRRVFFRFVVFFFFNNIDRFVNIYACRRGVNAKNYDSPCTNSGWEGEAFTLGFFLLKRLATCKRIILSPR